MSCCRRTTSCYWVSFGGPVNASTGHVPFPGWENTPLRSLLEADFGVPVSVDNDANVAALGSIALALDRDMTVLCTSQHWRRWWLDSERTPWHGAEGMKLVIWL